VTKPEKVCDQLLQVPLMPVKKRGRPLTLRDSLEPRAKRRRLTSVGPEAFAFQLAAGYAMNFALRSLHSGSNIGTSLLSISPSSPSRLMGALEHSRSEEHFDQQAPNGAANRNFS
jgi:hypothetical protein